MINIASLTRLLPGIAPCLPLLAALLPSCGGPEDQDDDQCSLRQDSSEDNESWQEACFEEYHRICSARSASFSRTTACGVGSYPEHAAHNYSVASEYLPAFGPNTDEALRHAFLVGGCYLTCQWVLQDGSQCSVEIYSELDSVETYHNYDGSESASVQYANLTGGSANNPDCELQERFITGETDETSE